MRVVPSSIVEFIDTVFPDTNALSRSPDMPVSGRDVAWLRTIVDQLDHLDENLLPSGEHLTLLLAGRNGIQAVLDAFAGRALDYSETMKPLKGYKVNPVLAVRNVMSSLPDQAIPEAITGLEFIDDETYRNDLRADIASVEALLRSGQWKATMVIAGGVMEGLLLDVLKSDEAKARAAAEELNLNCKRKSLDEWHLPDYVKVARQLDILSETSAEQAELAGDCRNLVHPGKEQREGRKATRKDAYSVVAGLEHVLEAVTAWCNDLAATR